MGLLTIKSLISDIDFISWLNGQPSKYFNSWKLISKPVFSIEEDGLILFNHISDYIPKTLSEKAFFISNYF